MSYQPLPEVRDVTLLGAVDWPLLSTHLCFEAEVLSGCCVRTAKTGVTTAKTLGRYPT